MGIVLYIHLYRTHCKEPYAHAVELRTGNTKSHEHRVAYDEFLIFILKLPPKKDIIYGCSLTARKDTEKTDTEKEKTICY